MANPVLETSGDAGWNTAADLGFTTASISPGANKALVLLIGATQDNASAGHTLFGTGSVTNHTVVSSGSGPTWTKQENTNPSAGFTSHAVVWTATTTSDPGSFTVTVDFPDTRVAGAYAYGIVSWDDHDTGTTFGGKETTENQAGNGAVTITLDAAPESGDVTVALSYVDTDGSGTGAQFGSTFGTWTELAEGSGTNEVGWNIGWRTGSTSPSVEWSDVNTGSATTFSSSQAAIVIKAAAGGGLAIDPTGPIVTVTPGTLTVDLNVAPAGPTVSVTPGTLAVTQFDVLYPASVSGKKLLDQFGNVYLVKTFSSWKMANKLSDADITTALEDVAGNGFNGVTVWCGGIEDRAAEGDQYTNEASDNFWTGTPWASSLGDAWSSVDHIVSECARLGMVLHFSFCAGFDAEGCGPDWEAVTNADMHQAGVDIATRYLAYPNIVWHIMFDFGTTFLSTRGTRVRNLFDGINDTEGAGERPVRWCENNNGDSTSEAGWLGVADFLSTINCMYEYGSNSVELFDAAYADESVPTGDCEPPYSGAGHYAGNEDQQMRERNYAVFLRGGCLINFGHEDWWPFGGAGLFTDGETWDTVQTDTEVVEASYAWGLIDTYCADPTWAPNDDFLDATGLDSGDAKSAAGASDTAALAYIPDDKGSFDVDTTIISGTGNVRLRWFDPTDGTFTTESASEAQNATRTITHPGTNAAGQEDWVLVVDLTETVAIDPTGPTVTVTPGTVVVTTGAVDITPTGPTVTVTPGTLTVDLNVAPAGPTVTVTPGTVVITTGAVDITPTGPTVSVTPGTLAVDLNVAPTGPTVSVTPGTVVITTGAVDITPTGPTVSVTPGTLTVFDGSSQAVAPTGPTVTVTPGTVTIGVDASRMLNAQYYLISRNIIRSS